MEIIRIFVERIHQVPEIIICPELPETPSAEEPKPKDYLSSALKWFPKY